MNWPVEVQEWRDAQLAANSRHPLLAFLLDKEQQVRAQYGIDPVTEIVPPAIRNIMYAHLASYFAEGDAERSKCEALIDNACAQFKQEAH